MPMNRIKVLWTGFQGAPGVSTFFSLNPGVDLPLIHAFFIDLLGYLPTDVTLTFPGTGDVLDETTGELTGTFSVDTPGPLDGTNGADYAAPAGVRVTWETGEVQDGHRLRGSTYLVPVVGSVFDTDGSIEAGPLAAILDAAQTLAQSSQLVVWHRPRKAKDEVVRPAVTARAGGYASVSDATLTDAVAVLTSRRD